MTSGGFKDINRFNKIISGNIAVREFKKNCLSYEYVPSSTVECQTSPVCHTFCKTDSCLCNKGRMTSFPLVFYSLTEMLEEYSVL